MDKTTVCTDPLLKILQSKEHQANQDKFKIKIVLFQSFETLPKTKLFNTIILLNNSKLKIQTTNYQYKNPLKRQIMQEKFKSN